MNQLKYILLAALCALFVSCGEQGKDNPTDSLTLNPTSLSFAAKGASVQSVTVTASGTWSATPKADWIHVSTASGSFSVTVSDNDSDARAGKISVTCGSASKEVFVSQVAGEKEAKAIVPQPAAFDGKKRASTTYQLLIYSFADSDGDGIGDFNGITSKLDYLDGMGVTALWLSPAHPTNSYHGYDVNDYFALNPKFGTEADFQNLINKAHEKGIAIYMDYVLNHSGTGTEWFKSVKADPKNSPYKDYYVLSYEYYPKEAAEGMGTWHSLGGGDIGYKGKLHFKVDWTGDTKYVTVSTTEAAAQDPNTTNAKRWIHVGSKGSLGMYETSSNIFELTIDVDTDWGFLVRSSNTTWDGGTKYGGKPGQNKITLGEPFPLDNSTASDIVFGEAYSYFASFDGSMPDLNYGDPDACENSRAFKSTVESATKWVNMGVDGFRLDAVVWIYGGQWESNVKFLDKWYQAVNSAYKTAGHPDPIFMVGEAWDGTHSNPEKYYYKGLPSNFEFDYGYAVRDMLKSGASANFASKVSGFVTDHTAQRADAITSFFLSNHDENRFASEIGETGMGTMPKRKQAAAILLSGPGKPFIYQGEELGYWGVKDTDDAYVRAPIMWNKSGSECAKKGVNNKVDGNMLKADISVEAQSATDGSILKFYQSWSQLRNTYPALATGTMSKANLQGTSIAAWYMTEGSQKLLVIHNVAPSGVAVSVSDSMDKPIALLGTATVKDKTLNLGGNSSVVFEL
jgi:glycosidase